MLSNEISSAGLENKNKAKGNNKMKQHLYYYSIESELKLALAHNTLRPSGYFSFNGAEPGIPLTSNPNWERIVADLGENNTPFFGAVDFVSLSKQETMVRIEVNPNIALCNWDNFLTRLNLPPRAKSSLTKNWYSAGFNPKQWRFSFDPIPSIFWVGIEYWDGAKWEPHPDFDPSGSAVSLVDHQEAVNDLTAEITRLECERDKARAEALNIKASAGSKDVRIKLLESSNSELQLEAEEAEMRLRHFLDSHTESALERKIERIEEAKESESFDKEILEEALEKANATIVEKDRAIDSQENYVRYLQTRLRTRGIPFTPHYGHESGNKDAA